MNFNHTFRHGDYNIAIELNVTITPIDEGNICTKGAIVKNQCTATNTSSTTDTDTSVEQKLDKHDLNDFNASMNTFLNVLAAVPVNKVDDVFDKAEEEGDDSMVSFLNLLDSATGAAAIAAAAAAIASRGTQWIHPLRSAAADSVKSTMGVDINFTNKTDVDPDSLNVVAGVNPIANTKADLKNRVDSESRVDSENAKVNSETAKVNLKAMVNATTEDDSETQFHESLNLFESASSDSDETVDNNPKRNNCKKRPMSETTNEIPKYGWYSAKCKNDRKLWMD
jgi:hypothetical protein